MEIFRTPDERFDRLSGYDFEPNYKQVDGLRLHYVDQGSGDPVVLFHGEPTWAYLYRKMIPPLAAHHRVIAPDFAGFGRSDKPTDRSFYTYDRHFNLVSGLLKQLGLDSVTVVVQDWGGPIGLRWAVENSEQVARLVIMNTALFTAAKKPAKAFMAWRSFAEANPDLPIGFVLQSATKTDLPQEVLDGYEAPFPNAESKAGAAQFPLIVPIEPEDPTAVKMSEIIEQLGVWQKPVLVAFSDSDPIFPPKVGQRFVDTIPGASELKVIEAASHFLQEDRGEQIAEEILAFIAGSQSTGSSVTAK